MSQLYSHNIHSTHGHTLSLCLYVLLVFIYLVNPVKTNQLLSVMKAKVSNQTNFNIRAKNVTIRNEETGNLQEEV